MSRVVQIRGDRVIFPINACVHCLRPASREVQIVKVRGHTVRKVKVPFCGECIVLRREKSVRQVWFERTAIVNSVLLALVVGGRVYSAVTSGQVPSDGRERVWGVLLGALIALIVFGTMYLIARPWSWHFRRPEVRAALKAVTIKGFDWETTTLEFANEEYAERFALVNQVIQEDKALARTETA
jgi:hypothetical protein